MLLYFKIKQDRQYCKSRWHRQYSTKINIFLPPLCQISYPIDSCKGCISTAEVEINVLIETYIYRTCRLVGYIGCMINWIYILTLPFITFWHTYISQGYKMDLANICFSLMLINTKIKINCKNCNEVKCSVNLFFTINVDWSI